jgi:hypothetical protein
LGKVCISWRGPAHHPLGMVTLGLPQIQLPKEYIKFQPEAVEVLDQLC